MNHRNLLILLLVCVLSAGYALPCEAAMVPLQGEALAAYQIEGGRVTTAGSAVKCKFGEVPAEIGGEIRYWAAIDADISDLVKEEETGVWFFSAKGVALRHLPFEGAYYACQEILFSPDQSAFVILSGSGIRPDITFEVYGQGPERLAELPGVRTDDSPWVDASRFVITRIDDIRTGENYENPEKNNTGKTYGWRTSLVLFDALANETVVLKESTATRNFFLEQVVEGGKVVEGWEQYVESEDDWGDSDKEQTRDFRTEIR